MTDPSKTSITVILDKSGSMSNVRGDTIGGYNTFVQTQKELPGTCDISLIQFSNSSEFTYKSKNIRELTEGVNASQYVPQGNTALLDAIGKAVIEKGKELADLPEDQRPGKVLFVIITDGQENASVEFNGPQIKQMIEHQQQAYQWDFTFLGANIDTFATADSLGISNDKALSFSTTKAGGAVRAFAAVSNYTKGTRGSKSAASVKYSDTDRTSNS
jgi:hypothetical protein